MIELASVVLVPLGNFDNDIRRAIRHGLAAEARFRRNPRSLIKFVELRVGRFIARFQAFFDHHVASRAGTHPTAGVDQPHFEALGNVKDAARQAVVAVGKFLGVDFHRLAAWKKSHLELLRRFLVFHFFDIRIAATHKSLPKPQPASCPRAPTAGLSSSAVRRGVPWPGSIHPSSGESVCSRCPSLLLAAQRYRHQFFRAPALKARQHGDYPAPWPSRSKWIPPRCAPRSLGAPQNPARRIRWTLPTCVRCPYRLTRSSVAPR